VENAANILSLSYKLEEVNFSSDKLPTANIIKLLECSCSKLKIINLSGNNIKCSSRWYSSTFVLSHNSLNIVKVFKIMKSVLNTTDIYTSHHKITDETRNNACILLFKPNIKQFELIPNLFQAIGIITVVMFKNTVRHFIKVIVSFNMDTDKGADSLVMVLFCNNQCTADIQNYVTQRKEYLTNYQSPLTYIHYVPIAMVLV